VSIYKPCDIRGHASELSVELYHRWGRALGMRAGGPGKFVGGGDVRETTPDFLASLVDGLCDAGMDVVDLGSIPTPMVYYAKRRLDADGCAIVTSSHNPADTNGLKWMLGDLPPSPKDTAALKEAGLETPSCRGRRRSTSRTLDVSFDYVAWLQEVWMETPPLRQPVVLDAMYGAWSCRARRYLQAIFPHTVFLAIHDTPNGAFGGCAPDCSQADLLGDLARAVEHEGAAMGIAFDGDGDRVAFVDNAGAVLTAEEATWLFLQSFGPAWPGERFVYDLKFSDRVPETARALGAEPLIERSGHAFIRGRMLKSGARFGDEISGHYFFRDLAGGDDGMFAACWLIDFLARTGRG
jgi:phosphomannomutase/phosphoglucomutase